MGNKKIEAETEGVETMQDTARKRGRPVTAEPRKARIYVSFTEKEYELLEKQSRAASLPVAVYVRSKAVNSGANS
jgi:hypothetical protein